MLDLRFNWFDVTCHRLVTVLSTWTTGQIWDSCYSRSILYLVCCSCACTTCIHVYVTRNVCELPKENSNSHVMCTDVEM